MSESRFKWLGRSTVTRSKNGSAGTPLELDHIYQTADFTEAVVDEWIATGHAEPVEAKAKNTVLAVKSQTIKAKAPEARG